MGGATGQKFANYWAERADDFATLVFQTLLGIETLGIFCGFWCEHHCNPIATNQVDLVFPRRLLGLEVACQVF